MTDSIDAVVENLSHVTPVAGETVRWNIGERMAHYGVPGVAVAVIDGGRLAWSRGFGRRAADGAASVDEHTLFQAASMSKPVAALAILREVEEGGFDLDAPVNGYLSSWHIPENALTRATPVTLRQILSHTAGLTVWGFGGYPLGQRLPTLPQVLSGSPPANSPPVFVDVAPATMERYSGGGTTIAQLALQERRARPYEEVLRDRVLEPLGMLESTFAQPLPSDRSHLAAAGHDWQGVRVEGGWHAFPEQAAAGLWATAADYARFLIGLQCAVLGDDRALIRRDTAQQMATVPAGGATFGLGPRVIGTGRARRLQHGGSNHGYICGSNAFLDGSRGVVVLTNSDAGAALAEEIIVAVARAYGWPDYLRPPRRRQPLTATQTSAYTGSYRLAPGAPFPTLEIGADGSALTYRMGTLRQRPLFAETATRFFSPESLYDCEFSLNAAGRATGIRVLEGKRVVIQGTRVE